MSPEKQRTSIAEACGWTLRAYASGSKAMWHNPDGTPIGFIPDYLKDLNAVHEAEKVLKGSHLWGEYKRRLSVGCDTGQEFPIDATAAQRAEAFLRSVGKWEDST